MCDAEYSYYDDVGIQHTPFSFAPYGVSNFQSCNETLVITIIDESGIAGPYADNITESMLALQYMETAFGCAGMCELSSFYTFSNLDQSPPVINCTLAVEKIIDENFIIYGVISFVIGGALFMGLAASFITCCCYKKRDGYME